MVWGILCLVPWVAHAWDDDCPHYLSTAGYYVQEASPAVLLAAIHHPESQEEPKVYADTIDQDFVPNERQQAEADAVRLAIQIQSEGGRRNPFDADVQDAAQQLRRLERHPRGAELVALWDRAGWMTRDPGGRWSPRFLVRNGLPRVAYYDRSPRARHEHSAEGLAERLPSVTLFVPLRPSRDERERRIEWWRTMLSLAARGHLGALARLPNSVSGLGYWFFHEFRPGEASSPVVTRPHPHFLYRLDQIVGNDPQMRDRQAILRVMRGDAPVLEDFVGWGSLIRQAELLFHERDSGRAAESRYLPFFLRRVVVPRLERYLEGLASDRERRLRLGQIFEDLVGRASMLPLREAIAAVATHSRLRERAD